MKTIRVDLGPRSYNIHTGAQLADLGVVLKALRPQMSRAFIISNPKVFKLYGAEVVKSLAVAQIPWTRALMPEGEAHKNLATVQKLYASAIAAGLDRKGVVVALGGGVVGDVAGFVSATYMRGVALAQVPTTLLAMVDSAIGGKTGVDLPQAKNAVGAFHQPTIVWQDPQVLSSLPARELRCGLAEVIKCGVIADAALFDALERNMPLAIGRDTHFLDQVMTRAAEIKARVVSKDERETLGLREILNFGHTLGHAIESVTRYKLYTHGEAIAVGMAAASFISLSRKLWGSAEHERLLAVLRSCDLPVSLNRKLSASELIKSMQRDKKNIAGVLRFVLPRKFGQVAVENVGIEEVSAAIQSVQPQNGKIKK